MMCVASYEVNPQCLGVMLSALGGKLTWNLLLRSASNISYGMVVAGARYRRADSKACKPLVHLRFVP